MAATKPKTVRIPSDLWDKGVRKARAEGTTISARIVEFLVEYTNENQTVTTELASIMSQLKAVRTRLIPDGVNEE